MIEKVISDILGGDAALTHPARFAIMITLIRHGALPMSELKGKLPLTFGNLGSHVAKLRRAGLLTTKKMITWKGLRTVVEPTRKGVLATVDHANAMQELLSVPIEEPAEAQEVFLISKRGKLIVHDTVRETAMGDAQLREATLDAINKHIKKARKKGEGMHELKFGTRRIILQSTGLFAIAIVVGQGSTAVWQDRLSRAVNIIREKYSDAIRDWDGSGELRAEIAPDIRKLMQIIGNHSNSISDHA